MIVTITIIISILSVVNSVLISIYSIRRNINKDAKMLEAEFRSKFEQMSNRIIVLETQVGAFWHNISVNLATVLHSPHPEHFRRDQLIELLQDGKLTLKDATEMISLLRKAINDDESAQSERAVAAILLSAIQQLYGITA